MLVRRPGVLDNRALHRKLVARLEAVDVLRGLTLRVLLDKQVKRALLLGIRDRGVGSDHIVSFGSHVLDEQSRGGDEARGRVLIVKGKGEDAGLCDIVSNDLYAQSTNNL